MFAIIDQGDKIEVVHPDNSTEIVDVPARGDGIGCSDPFRREARKELFVTSQRADGVVVIILPTLGNHSDHPFPSPLNLASYRQWNADAISLINADLAQYSNIQGIVWDIRGNGGGAAEYGMGLIGSLGNSGGGIGNCYARDVASTPPTFGANAEYPFPYQIFADQPMPTIQFAGKQAIVTDGMSVSAADWMTYRASEAGWGIFGHGSAGAYGYTIGGSYVNKSIEPVAGVNIGLSSYISGAHCVDANGVTLEGQAPVTTVVDFSPQDLAAGIDTQIEAAAQHVLN